MFRVIISRKKLHGITTFILKFLFEVWIASIIKINVNSWSHNNRAKYGAECTEHECGDMTAIKMGRCNEMKCAGASSICRAPVSFVTQFLITC